MTGTRTLRSLLLFVAGAIFLTACTVVHSPPGTETTVILLRHADRTAPFDKLNEKGIARAKALPAAVADLDIDVIYSPDRKRNLETVKPLIDQRNIDLKVVDILGAGPRMIEENPGKTVLWVGNTDNLQTIYGQLGGKGESPEVYGDIFIMTIGASGPPKIEKRNFGGKGDL
jgi:Histidine phosphatase superfamily (branch 1)